METLSALLAICARNSPVTGEFPTQRPVTRSFDVFFDLRLNKRLSKQSWDWWFQTPRRSLWRPCNKLYSGTGGSVWEYWQPTKKLTGTLLMQPDKSWNLRERLSSSESLSRQVMAIRWDCLVRQNPARLRCDIETFSAGPLQGDSIRDRWVRLTKGPIIQPLMFLCS